MDPQLVPQSQAAAGTKSLSLVVGWAPAGWQGVARAQRLSLGEGPAAPICLTPNIGCGSYKEEPQREAEAAQSGGDKAACVIPHK